MNIEHFAQAVGFGNWESFSNLTFPNFLLPSRHWGESHWQKSVQTHLTVPSKDRYFLAGATAFPTCTLEGKLQNIPSKLSFELCTSFYILDKKRFRSFVQGFLNTSIRQMVRGDHWRWRYLNNNPRAKKFMENYSQSFWPVCSYSHSNSHKNWDTFSDDSNTKMDVLLKPQV